MKKSKVEIEYDPSNGAKYITVAHIGTPIGTPIGETIKWECLDACFGFQSYAMNFYKPQLDGEWRLGTMSGYEGDLNKNSPWYKRGARYIKIGNILFHSAKECISLEAAEGTELEIM
jgi:hypothetical protein